MTAGITRKSSASDGAQPGPPSAYPTEAELEAARALIETMRTRPPAAANAALFAVTMAGIATGAGPEAERVRRSAALEALERLKAEGDPAVQVSGAAEALQRALRGPADAVQAGVYRALDFDGSTASAAALFTACGGFEAREGEAFAPDEAFLEVMAGTGPVGEDMARAGRESSRERVSGYLRGEADARSLAQPWQRSKDAVAPVYLVALAIALWKDRVAGRVEEERRRGPPALAYAVHDSAARLFSRRVDVQCIDGQMPLALREGQAVKFALEGPALADVKAIERLRQGVALFGSVVGHRVIRDQIFTGHRQALDRNPDPRLIVVEGGWTAYAERLKMHGKKAAEQIRDVVEAENACEIPLPDGSYGRLLSREITLARGRASGRLTLILGTALLPNYVPELQRAMGPRAKSREMVLATRLVPVLPLPPFVGGRANEQGPQATLSMDVVSFLRERARELVEEGGVLLDAATFRVMAKGAGVPVGMAAAVLDRWTQDADDGPAFLKRVGPDRYTLGDAHAAARAFVEDAGRRSIGASEAGRVGAERRQKVRATALGGRRKARGAG